MSSETSNTQTPSPSGRTPESGDLRNREQKEGWAEGLDRVDAFSLGASIAVEPDRIEQELSALWRKAAERAQSEGARFTVTRACLWNLIIHSDGEAEFKRTKRLIDELSESVPARIISLHEPGETHSSLSSSAGSPLRASIEANFRRSGSGRREVLAEEITLEAPRTESQRLPGLVRSLLLPDIPTALFVRNPSTDYHWLPRLAPEADRFIFDSGKLPNGAALQRVYRLMRRMYRGERIEIADLGWLRLWPWRMLLAALFDPPAAAESLRNVEQIVIHHGADGESSAHLLGGWLLGRLRISRDKLHLCEVASHHPSVGPAEIERVILTAKEHVYSARAMDGNPCICLESPFQPERIQPVSGRPDFELMVAAMGVGGRDPLMYEALRLGTELVRSGA